MGFFDRYFYGKAGKRDYSEMDMPKNRVSLFFLVLKDHFFDLIKINFLQLVFWLPFLIWTYINMMAIGRPRSATRPSRSCARSIPIGPITAATPPS